MFVNVIFDTLSHHENILPFTILLNILKNISACIGFVTIQLQPLTNVVASTLQFSNVDDIFNPIFLDFRHNYIVSRANIFAQYTFMDTVEVSKSK
jgi:hypothetical protein